MLNLIYRQFEGFENALTRQIAAYRKHRPDAEFSLSALDVQPLYEAMIAGGGAKRGDADLFMAVTDWLPELIRDGHIDCLDDRLAADPPPDWPDGWADSVLALQRDTAGRIYGLPYHDGPEVFLYRTDLFGDPREQERFRRGYGRELAPPRTWSEFLDLARFFHRPDDGLAGCVVAAKPDGHNDVYDFMLHLWSRGGRVFDERMRPAFAGSEGQEALRFYLDLIHTHRVTQPNPWEDDSVSSGAYYAGGRAAMMWNWAGFQTVADLPEFSAIPGRTRAAMLPGGDGPTGRRVSLLVYWVMTIPSGSRRKDDAWAFLTHLARPEMDRITALAGGSGVRRATWNDPAIRARFQYYEVIEEVHRQVAFLPRLPEYPAINELLNRMMARATIEGVPIEAALRDAAGATEAILAEAGYER
ncbi:MAG TPA: extracellular solute-binding protein [Thermomicrobiales bacterium]